MKVVYPNEDRPFSFAEYISAAYRNKNRNRNKDNDQNLNQNQDQGATHEYFSAYGTEPIHKTGGEIQGKGTYKDKTGKLTADTLMNAKERQGRPFFS